MKEAQFYRRSEEILFWLMERFPVNATYMGIHEWDGNLGDYSLEGLNKTYEDLYNYLEEINTIKTTEYSKEGQIDYILFKKILQSMYNEFEKDETHLYNPNYYLGTVFSGVMSLIMKEFAPLSERLNSLSSRLEGIPELLENAQKNLKVKKIPVVWVDVSLEQSKMASGLFKGLIPGIAARVPELKDRVLAASLQAAEAVEGFTDYLQNEVLPNAIGDFAVGEERFNELLRENHLVDYDAEELIETGRRLFEETIKEMEKLALEIDPARTVQEILEEAKKDHPSAEELIPTYIQVMEKSRQFVIDKEIATIPEREELTIIETPSYLRPIIPYAAYMQPGIFEEKLEGFFLVTPVDRDSTVEEQEEKLKGHLYSKLPITTLHEGYPGHHLQLVWSVTHGSVIRKLGMFLSTLFIEGWAFYCEELMEKLGFINEPVQRLARLSDQLWRAARIILDVSLHCKGMGVEEAVKFLIEECGLEPTNALAEVRRYTSSPTQPQSYLMGKLQILDIIDQYKKVNPEKSLKEIHDSILSCGSLPPKLMREQLFG